MTALLVALAGGVGAAVRFCVDTAVRRVLPGPVPAGTLVVNLSGSFLLGLLTAVLTDGDTALAVLGVGFCGGYTTFGTAMVEAVRLAGRGRWLLAVAYHLGTVVVCVAAAALGFLVAGG